MDINAPTEPVRGRLGFGPLDDSSTPRLAMFRTGQTDAACVEDTKESNPASDPPGKSSRARSRASLIPDPAFIAALWPTAALRALGDVEMRCGEYSARVESAIRCVIG